MSRRRLFLLAVPVALVVLLGVGAWALWPRERSAITRENAERIQLGMTLIDVQAILDGPARIEQGSETSFGWFLDFQHPPQGAEKAVATHVWVGRYAKVEVDINADGRVISFSVRRPARDHEPFYDTVRRSFGR
jgi:hypothetical protein